LDTLEEKGRPKEGSGLCGDLDHAFGRPKVLFGDPKKTRAQLNSIESIGLNPAPCSSKKCVVAEIYYELAMAMGQSKPQ
jgi:hypothetical protein